MVVISGHFSFFNFCFWFDAVEFLFYKTYYEIFVIISHCHVYNRTQPIFFLEMKWHVLQVLLFMVVRGVGDNFL